MCLMYNSKEFNDPNYKHKNVSIDRNTTLLTGRDKKSTDWRQNDKSNSKNPSNKGLPGTTAAMRRVRAKFISGKTLTPKEKELLAKMRSIMND